MQEGLTPTKGKVIIINSGHHKNQYSALIFIMHAVIYSGSHLPIEVIVRLIHMWSVKTPVGKAQDELEAYISTVK